MAHFMLRLSASCRLNGRAAMIKYYSNQESYFAVLRVHGLDTGKQRFAYHIRARQTPRSIRHPAEREKEQCIQKQYQKYTMTTEGTA